MESPQAISPETTSSYGKLFAALSKAQLKMVSPTFDKEAVIPMKKGGKFKYKYTSLNAIQAALKLPLAENELTYLQFPTSSGNKVIIETIVGHSSGEFISREFSLTASSSDVKDIGGCISYGKRYALASIFQLSGDEDLDATSVSEAYVGNSHQKRWLTDKLREMGVPEAEMGDYHNKMIENRLPASDTSILTLIEGARA